jgi:hypothetical protein
MEKIREMLIILNIGERELFYLKDCFIRKIYKYYSLQAKN